MATFNFEIIRKEIQLALLRDRKTINIAFLQAQELYNIEKEKLLKELDEHVITQEINAGPKANNISQTLSNYGNLFSYIGFHEGSDPIEDIRDVIRNVTYLKRTSRGARFGKTSVLYKFSAYFPDMIDIYRATPFPDWAGGLSWVKGIETGNISGVGYYLYLQGKTIPKSKSGPAIQTKTELEGEFRPTSFSKHSYVSELLEKFKKRVIRF